MAMIQCPNGHLYDNEKNAACPFCGGGVNPTIPLFEQAAQQGGMFPPTGYPDQPFTPPDPTAPNAVSPDPVPPTTPLETAFAPTRYKDDVPNSQGIIEVRGWLVCLEGALKGVDYKIHAEKNFIGRGFENDIQIDFDDTVSQGVNATIAYDMKNNKFFIAPSNSKNNIYVNDALLLMPVELKDYDVIEIGNSVFLFRSLCNERFSWEKYRGKNADSTNG